MFICNVQQIYETCKNTHQVYTTYHQKETCCVMQGTDVRSDQQQSED